MSERKRKSVLLPLTSCVFGAKTRSKKKTGCFSYIVGVIFVTRRKTHPRTGQRKKPTQDDSVDPCDQMANTESSKSKKTYRNRKQEHQLSQMDCTSVYVVPYSWGWVIVGVIGPFGDSVLDYFVFGI